jgi:outer membrane protein OmpA-like peptidoglycan-associated protein
MKRSAISSLFMLACAIMANAQDKPKYTASGGLLGAVNFPTFAVTDGPSNVDYKTKAGFGFGAFVNFPLGRVLSFEPQFQYNMNSYAPDNSPGLFDGKMNYIAVPLLLKFNLGQKFALTAGPEVDFVTSLSDDNNNNASKGDLKNTTLWNMSGGLEVFPHGRVSIFGRYIHGMTTVFQTGSPQTGLSDYKHRNIQAGIKFKLFGHKIAPVVAPVVAAPVVAAVVAPVDTDGDGITDNNDKCPTVAGVAKYNGCPVPDTDGDGINDDNDKCPTVAGIAKYQGCPIPDTDGDGINDENDKCPTVAGLERYQGCPIPDTDNDGVNDEEDLCPQTSGIASNRGCPELVIYYKRDVAELSKEDKAGLDEVVTFLNSHPDVHVKLEGHTSTLGEDAYNMTLSKKRVDNSKKYLVSKGINADRIETEAFGEKFPIGDNSKEEGRALSRRVVIKVK